MADPDDEVRVRHSSRVGQLSILVLEAGGFGPTLASSFAAAAADPAQIVVVDCLDLAVLPVSTCAELISAHQQLAGGQRQLIVVNAPELALPSLRSQGVEVAATSDRTFAGDPAIRVDQDAQAITMELAAAEMARDEAFALRDQLELAAEASSDREPTDSCSLRGIAPPPRSTVTSLRWTGCKRRRTSSGRIVTTSRVRCSARPALTSFAERSRAPTAPATLSSWRSSMLTG